MLFSSMIFLWVFLPIVIIGNFAFSVIQFENIEKRMRVKNIFLLIFSIVFYAWGGIYYVLIMIFSILLNFFGGYILEKKEKKKNVRKYRLFVILFLNLAMLFYFKYFNMLIVMIEAIMQADKGFSTVWTTMMSMERTGNLNIKDIVLPIGISFFTFQSMSYVIDLYMGKVSLQKDIINFALYVSLFPQLIAGPIVKYSDVSEQIENRSESLELFVSGQKRFCYGLGKKVIIANTFAEIADQIWALETTTLGTAVAWFGAIAYTIQIYYDFSGYSDMAVGIGKMLGFQFKENFNYPYTSLSIQEFWRRWHISLSTWFKEYIYIPLGGNRKGNLPTYMNIFIVFLLTGIWHGANFTFLAWGIFFAILQIIERLFLKKILDKNPIKIINWIYMMLMVIIGWVYFRSENILQANEFIKQMFYFTTSENNILTFLSMKVIILFMTAIICTGFLQRAMKNIYVRIKDKFTMEIFDFSLQGFILIYSIFMIMSGTYNPFIYFQF
ncbi:MAG: MBOAT family protein [Lachnospiraceae bacterium]|nr:MBOAT family protein [Lachnospiraceae bacterium]